MIKGKTKEVYEISSGINRFLYEKDKGESISALIVSLSLMTKRNSLNFEDYLETRKKIITRLMDITNLNEIQYKEISHLLKNKDISKNNLQDIYKYG